jgi:Na+-driven multidrug efflux pump
MHLKRLTLAFLLFLASFAHAQNLLTGVEDATFSLCAALKGLMPVVAMLMIVMAGVIYAASQMMGAETRARANVWATAALTGALIAILIIVIAPPVLGLVSGEDISCEIFVP